MSEFFSRRSPSARQVLAAVLDTLAERGFEGLTLTDLQLRAGPAGAALADTTDLEALVVAALEDVELVAEPEPSGDLRRDLRRLLAPWQQALTRDERAVAAISSAAAHRPRLKVAVHESVDQPITHAVAAVVARARTPEQVPDRLVQTLCWVLRALLIDRLRSRPRLAVDLDLLVDFLLAGLHHRSDDPAGDRPGGPGGPWAGPSPA